MQERHINREKYFKEQWVTTEKYVIPFIQSHKPINAETSVLEIGCGEGGNLAPFLKIGCKRIVGIDILEKKIENAKKIFEKIAPDNTIEFICNDIFNISAEQLGQFDIIMLRDVVEHIYNQEKFMHFIKKLLKPDGKIFIAFPPWYNPFGGHQQICKSKFLSKLPFFHILPKSIYKFILKLFGETPKTISDLLEIKETGITIERFEKIIKNKYKTDKRVFYFINPNYEIKFGLKPRVAPKIIYSIPFFRNFFITTTYYLLTI